MKYYIKQKAISWGDKFDIYDENGNERYYVEGEAISFGKKLRMYNMYGNEVSFIHQEVFRLMPRFLISIDGNDVCEVSKKLTFFRQEYYVDAMDWVVEGDFFAHEYTISENGRVVVTISKEWFSWGDAYEIDVADDTDQIIALSVVLVIDAILAMSNGAGASAGAGASN